VWHVRVLSIKVFPGATNLPLWTAVDRGFLAERGLALDIRHTGGSVEQLTELVAGKHDLVLTLMDNVVAYRSRQGEVAAEGDSDLIAVFGCDDGFPRFSAQSWVSSFEDLRGRTISVDAMTTGLAFLLRRLLAQKGIAETDLSIIPVGGVLQRWEAMVAGGHDATFLDPANRSAAVAMLMAHLPALDGETAEWTCAAFLDDVGGLFRHGLIRSEGVASLLDLRREFGPAGGELSPPEDYFDLRYLRLASAL
jgi:ABC-type nitrate/sulfonate/bicarbonate transport system substrate-binding protein